MRGRALAAAVCLWALAASACLPTGLDHAAPSAEALARDVLQALERRDAVRLRSLALTEAEFGRIVWPELPAARPERNLPLAYVWGDLQGKSNAGLRRVMAASGGRGYALTGVQFLGGTTQYRSYLVHRQARLLVRDERGHEQTVRLFGSVLERRGRFKVFSYVVD
jgi:hypothetical protein